MKSVLVWATLLLAGSGNAQSWFPEGATWYYGYSSGFPPLHAGYIQMQVDGDTLLGDELSVKLRSYVRYWLVGTSQGFEGQSGVGQVVNESNGLVRIWVPHQQAYDTLYDMRALPGERWQLPPLPAPIICDSTSYAQVVDTGHVSIDGVSLRWLAVEHHFLLDGAEYTVWNDTIIERIGLNLSFFTPHGICNAAVDAGGEGPLRCYSDGEISFNRFEPWSCEFVLEVADVADGRAAGLVPMGDGAYRVQLPATDGAVQFTLFDAAGRHLLARSVRDGDVLILTQQGVGIYQFMDHQQQLIGKGRVAGL